MKYNPLSDNRRELRIANLLWWPALSVFFSILVAVLIFVFNGEQIMVIRWLSYIAPWISIPLIVFSILSIRLRRRFIALISLLLAVCISYPFISLSSMPPSALSQAGYKVMSYSKMGRNRDIQAVADVVLKQRPDVLFMQEISKAESAQLLEYLNELYSGNPVYALAEDRYGLILSRFPLTSVTKPLDFSFSVMIDFPEAQVIGWNVHLQKPIRDTDQQYEMVEQLSVDVASVDRPVIVAGDFNATVVNYPYRLMRNALFNTFEIAGSGFGFTFPSPARRIGTLMPFIRIDHVFVSPHWTVLDSYVVNETGGSDHYPVVALVVLNLPKKVVGRAIETEPFNG